MWQSIQLFFYRYFMQKRLKEHQVTHEVVNLHQAKEVGILFDATNEQNVIWVRRLMEDLEKSKKKVSILGFINSSHANEQTAYPCFSRKETNWYMQPVHFMPNDFSEKKFDILINAFIQPTETLEYISTFSNARFRVGCFADDKTHCYDLMINLKDTDTLPEFIQKALHYLQIINNNERKNTI